MEALIERTAGEDVAAMISRIFVSCEYGVPKSLGLFVPVLAELGISPSYLNLIEGNRRPVTARVARTRPEAASSWLATD